jgi:hypothetical protein
MTIWYIFLHFGTVYQEKSGNPGIEITKSLACKTPLENLFPFIQLGFRAVLSLRKILWTAVKSPDAFSALTTNAGFALTTSEKSSPCVKQFWYVISRKTW